MTVLDIAKTIIAPIADPSATLVIAQYAETERIADPTSVRTYAGGVRRIVSTPGRDEGYAVSYERMSRADYDALRDLVSVPVLFRDQRGRAVFGVIAGLVGVELAQRDLVEDVSFTLSNITYSEVV
jgi:hypothetical protein